MASDTPQRCCVEERSWHAIRVPMNIIKEPGVEVREEEGRREGRRCRRRRRNGKRRTKEGREEGGRRK